MAGIYEGASTIMTFATSSATWATKIVDIKRTGIERKHMDSTLLTDTDHQYIPSTVNEPGMAQCRIHYDPQNAPLFSAIETIKIIYPATATGTYTATTARPSESCNGFVTKIDIQDIKIEGLIDAEVTVKFSGTRTVSTGS